MTRDDVLAALAHIEDYGFGDSVDDDAVIERAARLWVQGAHRWRTWDTARLEQLADDIERELELRDLAANNPDAARGLGLLHEDDPR